MTNNSPDHGLLLLHRLIEKGHKASINQGVLAVTPKRGADVPAEWLSKYSAKLVIQILGLLGLEGYRYEGHSTGLYEVTGGRKREGLQIQFTGLTTHSHRYAIFNVDLKRKRTTKHGNQGQALPKGQFRVGKKSAFFSFWERCGLPIPSRLGKFSDRMGNLKGLIFQLESPTNAESERVDKSSIRPLNVTYENIRFALKSADKLRTTHGQLTDNLRTRVTDKHPPQSQTGQGLQPFLTADRSKCGNKVIRECGYKGNNPLPVTTPKEQTEEEWLKDYLN